MTDREVILEALKAPDPSRGAGVPRAILDASNHPLAASAEIRTTSELWQEFENALTPLGGRVLSSEELKSLLVGGCYIDADARPLLPVVPARSVMNVWEADIGITTALLAVAESGSLLLAAGSGKARLASLAPPIHIVIVPREAIVATLEDAFARVTDRTSVLITGTSRTADIEGVLVRGVHGPRELWVVPIGG